MALLQGLDFGSALEVGCGLGRITSILATLTADLTAIDIGPDQVEATGKRVPSAKMHRASLQDWEPSRTWDLVVATEVLMHIPPNEIQAACDKLRSMANRWVVTVDWTEPIRDTPAEHNWLHDYRDLFGIVERAIPIGQQSIFVVRP